MKRTITFYVMAVILFAIGCGKTDIEPQPVVNNQSQPDLKSSPSDIPIMIDETIAGGNLRIYDDADGIYMIATLNGWEFYQNYIYIGTEAPESPSPGQFPYSGTVNPTNRAYFSISFDELGASEGEFYIAFYAKVKPIQGGNTSDAWAVADVHYYFYNNGGNQVGWGSYFIYQITEYNPVITIGPVSDLISLVSAKVKYTNFRINGDGPEMYYWPDEGISNPGTIDFQPNGNYYIGGPNSNHIRLQFQPVITDNTGSLYMQTTVTSVFNAGLSTTANPGFNVIQLNLYRLDGLFADYTLNNITVNGVDLGGFQGRNSLNLFNIVGDLIPPSGICTFDADLEIHSPSLNADDNYIEVSFGNL